GLIFRIVRACGQEYADVTHPLGLLRARCERPRRRCAAEKRDEIAPLYPNHVMPRACAVWVPLQRTFAPLADFARCLGRVLAVGARHEGATVCRFGRLGAWGRLLAVDFVSASVKANGPMASGLVRGFDASNPRTLHAGKRLSGGLPVDLAGWAALNLRPVARNAPKAIAARSRRPEAAAMTAAPVYQAPRWRSL